MGLIERVVGQRISNGRFEQQLASGEDLQVAGQLPLNGRDALDGAITQVVFRCVVQLAQYVGHVAWGTGQKYIEGAPPCGLWVQFDDLGCGEFVHALALKQQAARLIASVRA